ncbi:MAG TPA: diguanylate cyclase [Methylotenera sp.]|nr:diguanylate cyclase [Methylotenera sp.]
MSSGLDIVEQLRLQEEGYAKQLPSKVAQLDQAFSQRHDKDALRTLRFLAHGLAGSGASFGYPELSEVARQLEIKLDAAVEADRLLSGLESEAVGDLLEMLYYATQRRSRQMPSSAAPFTIPINVEKKLIYLVDDDIELAANLALQLGHFGYQAKTFDSPEQLYEAIADPALAAILMDIIFPQGDLAGAEVIMELAMTKHLDAPVVFTSVRNDLPARLAAIRAGAAAYIKKPVDIGALVSTLDELTSNTPPEPYRVLIMDDTEALAEHYAYTLKLAGMLTEVVTDPMSILSHLADFRPDLVLMDMYMPGCTGSELAAVIRQLDNYTMVPIVFLSTENDTNKQLTAMKLGGDDFLTKPITPVHLVSAVSTRLRRYRTLRSFIERDGLTGLLNHAAIKQRLALETARTVRLKHAFCLIMLDLDHFKTINDTYGHLVGDRALKNLAELLKRRLRPTDIIGRVGGEEFAIILLDTESESAAKLLDELRNAFSKVRQYADDHREFNITFSCGVAEYRTGDSADDLYKKADQALYHAKEAGRNQVVIAS